MSINFINSDPALSRNLFKAHGVISQPAYRVIEYFKRWGNPLTPNIFDNCCTKAREIAYRSFGPFALTGIVAFLINNTSLSQKGLIAAGVVAVEAGRMALHLLAFANQKKNYIHVRGEAPEIESSHPKIMTWNILGFPAGMNYTCGGCIPFRKRFSRIAQLIHSEKPEIVILQECLLDASIFEMIITRFKDQYAHFFIHNGPNKWGTESGLLVMTKCAVADYTFTPFDNNKWTMKRGFATLTIKAQEGLPAFTVIGTHMEAGYSPENVEKRKEQLAQIHSHAKGLANVTTAILVGDLNIDAARDAERKDLDQVLDHVYAQGQATCTNELNRLRYPENKFPAEEWVDQITIIKRDTISELALREFKVIPVYNNLEGKIDSVKALSDHNALVATVLKK
jgi:endonuclease/exonuclease/phosphatase family metal-dependent hydrolase